MKASRLHLSVACSLCLIAGGRSFATGFPQTMQPAVLPAAETAGAPARKLNLAGLPNFGQVTDTLYRGGQPTEEGFRGLQRLGVQIVINFHDEKNEINAERRRVEALGMRYVSIPWSGFHLPSNQQVAEFLEVLRANPEKKAFVHCHRGSERTGVMVAAFRMAMQNWTPKQALKEMKEFRFHGFWFRHLKTYVEGFPQQLEADPSLRTLRHAARTSAP